MARNGRVPWQRTSLTNVSDVYRELNMTVEDQDSLAGVFTPSLSLTTQKFTDLDPRYPQNAAIHHRHPCPDES
jgi:hypothetical protein